jgi:hypothetical protein
MFSAQLATNFELISSKLKKCGLFLIFKKKSSGNSEISIFLKNSKRGVQTVRLDELNNIVTWANISFIFQN